MKCENCGNEDVNFELSLNVDGDITEKHLCSECADKLGYSGKYMPNQEASFEEIFSEIFGSKPSKKMLGGYGLVFPTFIVPTMGGYPSETENDERTTKVPEMHCDMKLDIDIEMKRRRETNMLRELMRKAAADNDFEKAAILRDSIKKIESEAESEAC